MKKSYSKQPSLAKNRNRNARKNQRIGLARDLIWLAKNVAVCEQCSLPEPLVFYGQHRNLALSRALDGETSLKRLKKKLQREPILCLNCATLRRKHDQATYTQPANQ